MLPSAVAFMFAFVFAIRFMETTTGIAPEMAVPPPLAETDAVSSTVTSLFRALDRMLPPLAVIVAFAVDTATSRSKMLMLMEPPTAVPEAAPATARVPLTISESDFASTSILPLWPFAPAITFAPSRNSALVLELL